MESEFASWAGFIEMITHMFWMMAYTFGSLSIFLGACGLAGGAIILANSLWKKCRLFRKSGDR